MRVPSLYTVFHLLVFFDKYKNNFMIVAIIFVFLINWSMVNNKKRLGVKVLVVQTGMFLSQNENVFELRKEILKHKEADIVVFSESPDIGFKNGSRVAFSHSFIDEIKRKKDSRLYILNAYGLVDREKYNYNLSLYIMNGSVFLKPKEKLVPFWETPGLFYKNSEWESPFFSSPGTQLDHKYMYKGIGINSYICYESMFVDYVSHNDDLIIVQPNFNSFKGDYDRIVKNGNALAYFNKASDFKNFLSVQNMGETIFVDNTGLFHWDVYERSKEQAIFLVDI